MKLLILKPEDKNIPSSVFVKDPQNYIRVSNSWIYKFIYKQRTLPHFFERIVVLDDINIREQDAHRLFNLLKIPGLIICPDKHQKFFTQG